jgi:hypothetical protein
MQSIIPSCTCPQPRGTNCGLYDSEPEVPTPVYINIYHTQYTSSLQKHTNKNSIAPMRNQPTVRYKITREITEWNNRWSKRLLFLAAGTFFSFLFCYHRENVFSAA